MSRSEDTLKNSVIQKKYYKNGWKLIKNRLSVALSTIKYLEENNTKTFLEKQNKDCARVGDFKVPDCLKKNLNPNLVQKSLSTNLNLISHFDSKR